MMKVRKPITCLLNCHHEATFIDDMKIGQRVTCRRCDADRTVVHVRQWTARCLSCTYRNKEGARDLAMDRAWSHVNGKRHSVVMKFPNEQAITLVPLDTDVYALVKQAS